MITMQEMMVIQKKFSEQEKEFNKTNNITYSNMDDVGISVSSNGVSLSFYKWDKIPRITYSSCNKDIPETFEEFNQIKIEKMAIENRLKKLAMEWKEICNKENETDGIK